MTVYIFGGSNTAIRLGWADSLAMRLLRKVPVQNMGLGATNSLNALVRLRGEVALAPGDVVVWTNAINDAICLTGDKHDMPLLLEYIEAMIRDCHAAGARFVPVLIDSFLQHLMVQQSEYAMSLLRLLDYYGLEPVNIPQKFSEETGLPTIPQHHFSDALHMVAQGELSEFVAEMTTDVIDQGGGYPADRPCLHIQPGTEFEVLTDFQEGDRCGEFHNYMLRTKAWMPPVSLCPDLPEPKRTEVEAVTMLTDPQVGRFTLRVGAQRVPLSATHIFADNGSVIALTACIRLLVPGGITVSPGESLHLDWNTDTDPIPMEMNFRSGPSGPALRESRSRILSVLVRHRDV